MLEPSGTAGPASGDAWLGFHLRDTEMSRRVREFPWGDSSLGPIESWSRCLRTAAGICLSSPFQMTVYWGPELVTIYNDAERRILGRLHPAALGMPARELLRESWDILEPQFDAVMSRGEAIWFEDHPLSFDRRGQVEVGYFTYSYSPLPDDDGGIGGVLLVSEDTTTRVLAQRRIQALSDLAARAMGANTEVDACVATAEVLADSPDVAFSLIYLATDGGDWTCVAGDAQPARPRVSLDSPDGPAGRAFRELAGPDLDGVLVRPSTFVASSDPESEARRAFVVPMGRGWPDGLLGYLVAGISDDIAFDDAYRAFIGMLGTGIGRSVAAARGRRLERERTHSMAALAEAHGRAEERAFREAELKALLVDLKAAQRRLATARDDERRRIERNLHDGAQQRLMAIRLELGMLASLFPDGDHDVRAELDRLRQNLDDALEELRELAHGLYPPLLASDGLYAALRAAARQATFPVKVVARDERPLRREVENAAYFCCLEALQNIAKHAGPDVHATLEIDASDGSLVFRIRDDGVGFAAAADSQGQGLLNLRDRLAAVDGRAEVSSVPGRGTTVTGRIPLS